MNKKLFVAVKIEPKVELLKIFSFLKLNFANADIKWVDTSSFHITIMFLGETHSEMIPSIVEKLKTVSYNSFGADILGLGSFSMNSETKVIWAGYADEGQMALLANKVVKTMKELGIKAEDRPFKAHLTLARVKTKCNEIVLNSYIQEYKNRIFQSLKIKQFQLFESKLSPKGTVYEVIEQFIL